MMILWKEFIEINNFSYIFLFVFKSSLEQFFFLFFPKYPTKLMKFLILNIVSILFSFIEIYLKNAIPQNQLSYSCLFLNC